MVSEEAQQVDNLSEIGAATATYRRTLLEFHAARVVMKQAEADRLEASMAEKDAAEAHQMAASVLLRLVRGDVPEFHW